MRDAEQRAQPVAARVRARLLPDHAEQPRLEGGVSVKPQPVLDYADVHVLQKVLRVFAPVAATRHGPAEALRVERLHLRRQIGVAHALVSARALYGNECVERVRHMTYYERVMPKESYRPSDQFMAKRLLRGALVVLVALCVLGVAGAFLL